MTREKIDLDLDLDALLPGDTITIGKNEVLIRPLDFGQYKQVISQLKKLVSSLNDQGVDLSKIEEPGTLFSLANILINDFPNILEETSGIKESSLNKLPPDVILELTAKVIEVNLKSKDSFLGNLDRLSGMITSLFPTEEKSMKKISKRKVQG